ncbi:MAG: 1-deoxy-D-xylulose-5-phosphate synthase [Armatimonadota bacterium]
MRARIMYVEYKGHEIVGPGCITRIQYSKSGSSIYFRGKRLQTLSGTGVHKSNYIDVETGEEYWVSGPRRDGKDRLYGGVVEIDDDVREEYWTEIRRQPDKKHLKQYRA